MVEPELPMATDAVAEETAPVDAPVTLEPPVSHGVFFLALALIFLGVGLLFGMAVAEVLWLKHIPWANALMVVEDGKNPEGSLPVLLRSVPSADHEAVQMIEEFLQSQAVAEAQLEQIIEEEMLEGADLTEAPEENAAPALPTLSYSFREHVLLLDLPQESWGDLLGTGRVPEPGKAEVLAGDLALQEQVELDGQSFEVVGNLKRGVSAMNMAYLLPAHGNWSGLFQHSDEVETGWLHPEGILHARDLLNPEDMPDAAYVVAGGRTHTIIMALNVLALIIIAIGGSMAHTHLFWALAGKNTGLGKPLFVATREWPRLFYWCHVFYFGLFFFAMYQGIDNAVWSTRISEYIGQLFAEGELAYIGDAYDSGNYLAAAAATWWNNYIMQTVLLTFVISIIPLGAGLFKTGFSFIQTGFAMPPMQVGAAGGFSYHSITMILELEAYIVACFAVILWMIHFYRALAYPKPYQELKQGALIMVAGVVLSGIMLAIAGMYEAVTLITFSLL